ncbi:MAG: insulinase family protein [Myxococcaceae bacterium]|nr:insulinase family protein [Myxococcaceae bacterium]MCI0671083.1 insulinase family protein [Myxococcaceae bacterium]
MSFSYSRDTLPNGLRVVTVETPHLHSALLTVYVRTGSRHETPTSNGVSHFVEHLFFRGSQEFPDSVAMNAAVEEVGGNLNGVTTRDHGYYYTPLAPGGLQVGMRILGDMLTRPLLSELETERQIILEEMLDEVDEEGRDIDVDNLSKMALFGAHPLAMKIAGTTESVRGLRAADVEAHFRRNYVAGNMVVCASGNVRRDEVLALAEEAFRHLPDGVSNAEEAPPLGPQGPVLHYTEHDESQVEFRLTFPGVPEQHPDYAALQLVRRVLDDGLSSRLPYEVVEKRGLAYSLHCALETYHDVGLFEVDGASAPEKAPQVVEETCRVLAGLCASGPTEAELARAKRRHRMFLDFAHDSPGELSGWFGATELFRAPEPFGLRADMVDAVTPAQVVEVARRYLTRERLMAVAVGPRKGRKALERAVLAAPGL